MVVVVDSEVISFTYSYKTMCILSDDDDDWAG